MKPQRVDPPGPDEGCIGNDFGEPWENGEEPCKHAIAFVVGGDFSCVHHLVRVARKRCDEVGGRAYIQVYP